MVEKSPKENSYMRNLEKNNKNKQKIPFRYKTKRDLISEINNKLMQALLQDFQYIALMFAKTERP